MPISSRVAAGGRPAIATAIRAVETDVYRARVARWFLRASTLVAFVAGLLAPNAQAHSEEEWQYTVRPGENLWMLTDRYLNDRSHLPELQRLNRISEPRRIPPGTRLRMPLAWTKSSPGSARITAVVGLVKISTPGQQALPATLASIVHAGDVVETDADASAVLEFADGTHVTLLAQSILFLEKLLDYRNGMTAVWIDLRKGRTESDVPSTDQSKSRYHIKTPAGVTSVRGTQLRVGVPEPALSRTEVLTGAVAVANAGREVAVEAGYGIVVRAGEPPQAPVVLLAAPDLSALPASVAHAPIEVEFAPIPGAVNYRVQLAAGAQFDRIVLDVLSKAPKVTFPVLPDGRYVMRARGIDGLGLEGRNAEHVIAWAVRPEAPAAVQPQEADILATAKPTFRWISPSVGDNVRYRLQIAQDRAFSQITVDRADLRDSSITLTQGLSAGVHYWRVAAVHADQGAGPFSPPRSFRIAAPSPAVEPATLTPAHIGVRWTGGAAEQRYRVQLARDVGFQQLIQDTVVRVSTLELPRPVPGRYYLRVLAVEPDGYESSAQAQRIDLHPSPSPPQPLSPAGESVIADERLDFRWQPGDATGRYRFQLARERGFAAPLVDITLEQTRVALERSLEPGVYFWRVAADSEIDGQGEFGSPQSLRRVPAAPDYGPAQTDASTLFVHWTPRPGAAQYEAELARDEAFGDVIARGRVSASEWRTARPDGGHYFIRIRALDADGVSGPFGVGQSVTVRPRPAPPRALNPDIIDPKELLWQAQEIGARYRIQISQEATFAAPLLDERRVEGTKLMLPATLPPGLYRWRIAAANEADGEGEFGEVYVFRVSPSPPTLTGIAADGRHLLFRWHDQPAGAQYQVQLARDTDFRDLTIDQRAATNTLEAPRPAAGKYFARIRSIDSDGVPGPYSSARSVEVPTRFPLWLLLPLLIILL